MPRPLSLRLDADDQLTLESAAKQRGVGLSTYLRQLAADDAKRVRRERIREQSQEVGRYVAESPDAAAFYRDWGSAPPDGDR
jgi:uncharacterized protein (DUF1778 family)